MNWTDILRRAGIPEPPGREEAASEAIENWYQRQAEKRRPLPPKPPKKGR